MYEYMEGSRMVSCLFGTTVVLCGATCYTLHFFVWAAPYFCYIFIWKEKFIATTNKQTLYTFLIASHSGLESFFQRYFGMFGKKYAGPVGYMTCHFAWTMTLAAASYLLWHSYLLYTCVFLFILVTAIHNGST
jgi:uncharacterized membrane protein